MRWETIVFGAVVLAGGVSQGLAQAPLTRQIVPVPFNDDTPVSARVELDKGELRIGTTVSICFQASKSGSATLWNISTKGEVTRVFPNAYAPGAATHVEGDHRYCAGVSGDPFRFRVDGPPGTEDLYLLWTARPELQPSGATYADAPALVADMQKLSGANTHDWATAKVTYDIVPAGGAEPPVLPPQEGTGHTAPPQQSASNTVPPTPAPTPAPTPTPGVDEAQQPKIFVLAMGANVEKLTKTNQDAEMFTRTVVDLFNVKADHVRMIPNATRAQWKAGFQWVLDKARPQDFVFIYFSGHGGRFKDDTSSDGWDEFLVPYDFEAPHPDPKNLIFSQLLATWINDLPTKNVVAVIDACHSAGVFRSIEGDVLGGRKKVYELPAELQAAALAAAHEGEPAATRAAGGRGRVKANGLLLAAAKREQYAIEASVGSIYTVEFVKEMRAAKSGTLVDAFNRTVSDTERDTQNKQVPEAVGDLDVGRKIDFSE